MAQVAYKTISCTGSSLSIAFTFLIYMFVSLFTALYWFVRKGSGALGCQHVGSLKPRQLNCRSLFPTFSNLVVRFHCSPQNWPFLVRVPTLYSLCPSWAPQLTCIWMSLPGASGLGNRLLCPCSVAVNVHTLLG